MIKFYSPLRYPGGKTKLAGFLEKAIEASFPKENTVTLVEPFAGGAGASLKLLFSGKVGKIVINDLDRSIFAFWKVAVNDTDFLINKIKNTEISISEWRKQKAIYSSEAPSQKKLAFATLFLNRTNRSGILDGGPIGGLDQSGKWGVTARFTKSTIIERLQKIKEFRKKIIVHNLDGITLLEKLGRQKSRDKYFIFLDPPYYDKGQSLYLNHYTNKNHQRLLKLLQTSPLKWVMTYDDVSYIQDLYSDFTKKQFEISHSAFRAKKGKEVLIFSNKTKHLSRQDVFSLVQRST